MGLYLTPLLLWELPRELDSPGVAIQIYRPTLSANSIAQLYREAKVVKLLSIFLVLMVCGGCAANPAASISQAIVDDVSLTQARSGADAYLGSTVRWGGVVTEVENKADKTWVFLVGSVLRDDEEPIADSASEGRFVASFNGFVDPLVYKSGRPLTVVGSIEGSTVRAIGEYDYRFPVVAVRDSYLWEEPDKTKVIYAPSPFMYDYYYYHPYPYSRRRW
jgi:outer membrane lipoprotein